MDRKRIEKALKVLIEEGEKAYREEFRADISDGCKVGQAISSVHDDCSFSIDLAGEHLEDWNHHREAKIVRDLFK